MTRWASLIALMVIATSALMAQRTGSAGQPAKTGNHSDQLDPRSALSPASLAEMIYRAQLRKPFSP